MPWVLDGLGWRAARLIQVQNSRGLSTTAQSSGVDQFQKVLELSTWDVAEFRQNAFDPAVPAKLVRDNLNVPAACGKWFTHHERLSSGTRQESSLVSLIKDSFFRPYAHLSVPLEITGPSPDDPEIRMFQRNQAPLALLLNHLTQSISSSSSSSFSWSKTSKSDYSIYLAQYPISTLPTALQTDLPTPIIVQEAGKGDIYDSSIWLGQAPTDTPLHRDPNPNLLLQLAGRKVVHLFPPQVGNGIFEMVQERLRSRSSPTFRGEEMMAGPEHDLLDQIVWSGYAGSEADKDEEVLALRGHGYHTTVHMGEAVFIPKGWWHSVKGVGEGVVASANWWFR